MRLSVVIPHWPLKSELDDLLDRCIKSLPPHDERVIVVNEGIGFAKAVNYGLRVAKGDFLAVVSNDTVWQSGDLESICIPGTVTSPVLNDHKQDFWGCFFVLPREVYEKVGPLDERFGLAYYEDNDYIKRLSVAGVPMVCVDSCHIFSEGGQTMKHVDDRLRSELNVRNKGIFDSKWGN